VILESGQLVDVDARTEDGQTALHLAAKKDNLPVALVLAEFHADLSALDAYELSAYSYTPSTKVSLVADFLRWRNDSLAQIRKAREVEEDTPLLQPCPFITKEQPQERDTEDTAACYSVLRLIGKGAFAHVYSAIHKATKLPVALKCLKKSLLEQQDMIKYVQIERHILSYLQHPFIERLYASFQTSSRLVLVLEYCAGGDLRSQLHTFGCFSEELAKKYAAEVFLAVEFLHRNGIIYRDLKLENIVLDSKGHIRLIDFGLSKDIMESSDETSSFCGSIGYLAPEMVAQKPYSMSIDWYMYGCLLYEMLTGQPPFKTFDVSRLLSLIESGNIQYPSSISPTAKSLIQGLTAKSPAKRLGKGRSGRSLIKSHAFFAGVDWVQVYQKRLEMPIPHLTWANEQEEDEDEALQAFGYSQGTNMFSRVRGWSFGDPNQL
jgi:serine/threonine protein kinase